MRGLLQIASARAPYRRAGLAWASRAVITVAMGTLDGERLKQLIGDRVLTIKVGQDDGSFKLMPREIEALNADELQMLIDSAPDNETIPTDMRTDISQIVDPLMADQVNALTSALERAKGERDAAIGELEMVRDAAGLFDQARAQLGCADDQSVRDRIAQLLEAEIALARANEEIAALKAAKPEGHKPAGRQKAAAAKPAGE